MPQVIAAAKEARDPT